MTEYSDEFTRMIRSHVPHDSINQSAWVESGPGIIETKMLIAGVVVTVKEHQTREAFELFIIELCKCYE